MPNHPSNLAFCIAQCYNWSMCGRFFIKPNPTFEDFFEKIENSPILKMFAEAVTRPLIREGEVSPTDLACVIARSKSGQSSLYPMLWGFTTNSSTLLINSRVETAAKSNIFADSWRRRRCIIPCSWYIEWEHHTDEFTQTTKTGTKYALQPRGCDMTYMAGLYRFEERKGKKLPVFTILTRPASDCIASIHDRMPLIFEESMIDKWLDPAVDPSDLLIESVYAIVAEPA